MATDDLGLPIYLGPNLARWLPRTTEDVQTALDDGTLTERHFLDSKKEVEATPGGKKELARDLASFANDGGALLIGVAEDKETGTFSLNPLELAGLSEQVEQVVHSRCDPPLYVECHPLPDPDDTTGRTGVLLVVVPQSPLAPHMVDGAYHGRGDKTKHKLGDREVDRLHARRSSRKFTADQIVDREIQRDPVEGSERSHLHVVALPVASPPDLLTELLETDQLREIVHNVPKRTPSAAYVGPAWSGLSHVEPREHGIGFHVYDLIGRQPRDPENVHENGLLDLEVNDDGRITLFCGRASDHIRVNQYEKSSDVVLAAVIIAHVRATVVLAGELAAAAGSAGPWLLTVGVTNLRGKQAHRGDQFFPTIGRTLYSGDRYVEATEAVTSELLSQPGTVTKRLLQRLLRGLRVGNDQRQDLEDEN